MEGLVCEGEVWCCTGKTGGSGPVWKEMRGGWFMWRSYLKVDQDRPLCIHKPLHRLGEVFGRLAAEAFDAVRLCEGHVVWIDVVSPHHPAVEEELLPHVDHLLPAIVHDSLGRRVVGEKWGGERMVREARASKRTISEYCGKEGILRDAGEGGKKGGSKTWERGNSVVCET